jgi:hypothetical protein
MTLWASQRAAREQRLWEKRTALYEALLDIVSTSTFGDPDEATRSFGGLNEHRVQILAYGSPAVLHHFYAAGDVVIWAKPRAA